MTEKQFPKNTNDDGSKLSAEAEEYLAKRDVNTAVPITTPDLSDPAEVLRWRKEVNSMWGEEDDPNCPHIEAEIADVTCLISGPDDAPLVVYAHGGGYLLGSAEVAIPITARLAHNLRVVSVNYRMAPTHPHPHGLNDLHNVVKQISKAGREFAIAGDSAGASLALAAAIRCRLSKELNMKAVVLLSPHLDHSLPTGVGSQAEMLDAMSKAHLSGTPTEDREASPVNGKIDGLPPVLIQIAANERSLSSAQKLIERIGTSGGVAELMIWESMWHAWHYHHIPEADRALAHAATFITSRMS